MRLELLRKQDRIVAETSAAKFAVSIASSTGDLHRVGLGHLTALCAMGCSSSALNKAGDSSRSGSGGEQGTHTAPTLGDSVCWLPPDPEGAALALPRQQGENSSQEGSATGRVVSPDGTEVCSSPCAHRLCGLTTPGPRTECCLAGGSEGSWC